MPRTSKTQHWKHGDRPRNILSMNARDGLVPLCWLSLFRQGHRTLGPVGKLGESESTPRTSETPSYGFLCTEFPRPVLSFSVFQHGPHRVFMLCGGPRGQNRFSCPLLPPCDGLTPSLEYSRYVLFVEYAPYLPGGVNEAPIPNSFSAVCPPDGRGKVPHRGAP